MVAHITIHPRRAAEVLEQAQIGDPYVVLANACEGGILKGYAGSTRTIHPNGRDGVVRGRRIPVADWRRIIAEGKVPDIATATVRLNGSTEFDGGPKVTLIEIGFGEERVWEYADRHGAAPVAPPASHPSIATDPPTSAQVVPSATPVIRQAAPPAVVDGLPLFDAPTAPEKNSKVVPPVPPGAVVMTIAQACVALSVSRTTLYALAKRGDLAILKGKGGSRVRVEDVNRIIAERAQRARPQKAREANNGEQADSREQWRTCLQRRISADALDSGVHLHCSRSRCCHSQHGQCRFPG